MKFVLHRDAALEHEEQVAWYKSRAEGLGQRYHDAFLDAVGRACERPHRFRITVAPDLRYIAIRGFPFWVIFREVDGVVQIMAVASYRRRPGYWSARKS